MTVIRDTAFSVTDSQKHMEFSKPGLTAADSDSNGDGVRDRSLGLKEKRSEVMDCAELEADQESGGSSEETESPKSVVAALGKRKKKVADADKCEHSQIMKIREEDSHLGEDIGDHFTAKDYKNIRFLGCGPHHHHHRMASPMDVMIISRPILPNSPLSGKIALRDLD